MEQSRGLSRGEAHHVGEADAARPGAARVARRPGSEIQRSDLLTRVLEAPGGRVVVHAPLGWGKTTLLDQLETAASGAGRAVVRVSLTGGDARRTLERALEPPRHHGSDRQVVLLDDFDPLVESQVVPPVAQLMELSRPGWTLVVAGRRLDGLPLTRLRTEGRLLELGERDLRFSPTEVDALLGDGCIAGDASVSEEIHAVAAGWPLGVAAMVSALGEDPSRSPSTSIAIATEGLQQLVLEEVEAVCSDDDVEFLRRVCVLTRLDGPSCDHVAQSTGSAERLRRLGARRVFVEGLDRSDDRFRLHPVLRSAFLDRAGRIAPDDLRVRHDRAGRWLLDDAEFEPAVEHLTAAGEYRLAADSLARWIYSDPPEHSRISLWVERLEKHGLEDYAPFLLASAREAIRQELPERTQELLDRLARLDHVEPVGYSTLPVAIGELRVSLPVVPVSERAELTEALLARDVNLAGPMQRVVRIMAAMNLYLLARPGEAAAQCEQILRGYRSLGRTERPDQVASVFALRLEALLAHDAGRRHDALDAHRRAVECEEAYGYGPLPREAQQHVDLNEAIVPDLEPEERAARLRRVADEARSVSNRLHALLELARLHDQLDDGEAAAVTLGEAAELVPSAGSSLLAERYRLLEGALDRGRSHDDGRIPPLTAGERAVLRRLPTELSQAEIADASGVSVNTIKSHLRSIYQKLGASSRSEAVARATDAGMLATVLPWSTPAPDSAEERAPNGAH